MTQQHYYHGVGRRKCAIAQVRLYTSPGEVMVNGKPVEVAFPWAPWREDVLLPLRVTETLGKYSIEAKVTGGGNTSRAGAVRHGIARALVVMDEQLRKPLRQHGLLTRDSRVKESKKYGLVRARKAKQYSKR